MNVRQNAGNVKTVVVMIMVNTENETGLAILEEFLGTSVAFRKSLFGRNLRRIFARFQQL